MVDSDGKGPYPLPHTPCGVTIPLTHLPDIMLTSSFRNILTTFKMAQRNLITPVCVCS